jgi:hypothetical protein
LTSPNPGVTMCCGRFFKWSRTWPTRTIIKGTPQA